jgi:molybdopterin/thiamine biosynthesis adenylyltransferase
VLREVGGPGQQKLKAARVLIVGAGGWARPAALYLAAAGVGAIILVDPTASTARTCSARCSTPRHDIGRPKAEAAADRLAALNPHIFVAGHTGAFEAATPTSWWRASTWCSTAPTTSACDRRQRRLRASRQAAGVRRHRPLDGQVGVFGRSLATAAWSRRFRRMPRPAWPWACVGALAGVIGSMMALEAIKLIVGAGEPLSGRLLLYDALSAETRHRAGSGRSGRARVCGGWRMSRLALTSSRDDPVGRRWPSIQVVMLMITFSPMSIRPSMVAEPRCGSRTALGRPSSFGLIFGSNSKTSRPAPAMRRALQQVGERCFVDDLAARGVDHDGVRLKQLQAARRQQVVGRRRVRRVDRDDVHPRQHLVEALPVGRLQLLGDARADGLRLW